MTTSPTARHRPSPESGPSTPPAAGTWPGLLAWAVVVVVALVWGTLAIADAGVALRAAPLAARWEWHLAPAIIPAVLVGVALAAGGPIVAARAPWRTLPWIAGAVTVVWTTALAASDGWDRITAPLTTRHEYEPFAAGVDDIGELLTTYTDQLPSYPIHVQGHPPGPVVLAWGLDRIGLGGAGWLAALALVGWGVAVAVALVAAREVAGEATARRAAPVLAVLPAAVWAGTSLDALFAGVATVGTALAVLAVTRSSARLAVGSGAVFGGALLLTYGTGAVLVISAVAAVVLGRDSWRRLAALASWATLGVAVPLGAAALTGFWWFDGLEATRQAYWSGVGGDRPGLYLTLVGNPAALALATGPAVAAGLAAVLARARTAWRPALLPGAALGAVLLANLSQLSRGEVERIWLPFIPWLALAAPGDRRAWIAAQVALALVLQVALTSPW